MPDIERSPEFNAQRRIIRRFMERVEKGDEVLIARIASTLEIDSETRPTGDQIAEFVKRQPRKHARRRQ